MYRYQRIGRVKNDKKSEAITWAKEIAEYINTKCSQVSVQVYAEVFGDLHIIYWHADYKDLATIEIVLAQFMGDQEYWTLVNKGMEFFIEGSFRDTLLGSV